MRQLMLTVAAAAVALSFGSIASQTNAAPVGNPAGVRAAVEDASVAEQVHCVPGRPHHYIRRGRWWDGCARGYYGGDRVIIDGGPVVVAPPIVVAPFGRRHGPGIFISDVNVKRDIVQVGHLANGLNLYSFRYLWSDQVYVGVMAQEVQALRPEAVVRGTDGYLRVNYKALGLHMQTWEQWTASQGRQANAH